MATDLRVETRSDELAQIVQSVFETMMSIEAAPCSTPWFPDKDRLISAVHLSGEWNGAVLFECSQTQACRFATRFLSMDPIAAVDDVVRDVLGELANMIGGNMKVVLSPNIRLSMPTVVDGSDYSLRLCKAEVRDRLTFQSEEGLFWVTVLVTAIPPAGSP